MMNKPQKLRIIMKNGTLFLYDAEEVMAIGFDEDLK